MISHYNLNPIYSISTSLLGIHLDIRKLNSLEAIAKSFNTDINFLKFMESLDITKTQNLYFEILKLKKKNKKFLTSFREVLKINKPFNVFYKELLNELEKIIYSNYDEYISENAHGFLRGKNTVSNSKEHLNKHYLYKFDIEDFFTSIKKESIESIFIKIGCEKQAAELFSNLCTYNNALKEGLNTSPLLANLFCYELDKDIKSSIAENVVYTRYGDDITFSSDENNFIKADDLQKILNKYNLKLNKQKTLFAIQGQPQYVTGLSISNKEYPRVSKKLKRKVRQKLYYMNKFFENNSKEKLLKRLYGEIAYIIGIEKDLGEKYKKNFLEILKNNNRTIDNTSAKNFKVTTAKHIFHYIDESEIIISIDKQYLAICVVSIIGDSGKQKNIQKLGDLKNSFLIDARDEFIKKEGLFHYTSDNPEIKIKVQDLLRELEYEAFIIFGKFNKKIAKEEYQELYYGLFSKIFNNILLNRFGDANNYICYEENSKISTKKLSSYLCNKKPSAKFKIEKISKEDILSTLPDYVLGTFCSLAKEEKLLEKIEDQKYPFTLRNFNKISSKIRLIIDNNNKIYYSRQNNNKDDFIEIHKSIIS
jgi:RNA-directed DNA polymerase (reverse transcriptase)